MIAVLGLAVAGCGPQSLRPDHPPNAEAAALAAMRIEPGPAPKPSLLNPSVALRASRRSVSSPALRLDQTAADQDNVWARIRSELTLPVEDRPRTRREIAWFQRNQDYLDRMADRARYYLPYIVRRIEKRKLPIELALLPIVESAFQPFANSPAGAAGIWQFIPSTGHLYGLRQSWWYDGRRDIVRSTRAALDYLSRLGTDFNGDWLLAIAAYNWGEGNVQNAVDRNRAAGKATDFWSLNLPPETRTYVPKLLALAAIVAEPARYDLTLRRIEDKVYFAQVDTDGQIDLGVAAKLAGISLDEMYLLNPGYHRWATDPEGPNDLLVPAAKADVFRQRLASLPPEQRVRFTRHAVRAGETLGQIAQHYGTSVDALRTANKLPGTLIRIGQNLVVPVAARRAGGPTLSEAMQQVLARVSPPAQGRRVRYTVRPGDNLWSIARHYGLTVNRLARWNGITANQILRPGDHLVVWHADTTPPAVAASGGGSNEYAVRPGDTLSGIATRFNVSVPELARWNRISAGDLLHVGQSLRLGPGRTAGNDTATVQSVAATRTRRRVHYTVRQGDSLWVISRRFGVSVSAVQAWNGLGNASTLQPGQTLVLFVSGNGNQIDQI